VASTEDAFLRNIGAVRRLLSLAVALAVAVGPLAAAPGVMAKERGEERRGEERRGEQAQRERPAEGRWAGARQAPPGWRGGEERPAARWTERADPRSDPRNDPRYDPRYEPRAEAPEPRNYAPAPRRGGILPQGGPVIDDYNRYHLRVPPRGFDWVRTQGGMALVHRDSGRVYDVVPY
jgi:Ni/Co efflux regulator RcnB